MRVTARKLLMAAGALAVAGGFFLAGVAMSPAQEEPYYVGSDTCADCHVDQWEKFEGTIHDSVLSYMADEPAGVGGCEACHGPGSTHVDLAGYEDPGFLEAIVGQPDPSSCTTCHVETLAQFSLPERHNVIEGFMVCSDCHDPHGSFNARFVTEAGNQNCYECHADKEGPWVFPHAAQEVDGCIACHQPHGSVNPHMLPYREIQFTCLGCHTNTPAFHSLPNFAECTACHTQIHGSNLDSLFLE